MAKLEAKWLNNRCLVLYNNKIEKGVLIYPKLSFWNWGGRAVTLRVAAGKTYELQSKLFSRGCTVKCNDEIYIKSDWNWLTEIDIATEIPNYKSKLKMKFRFWFPKSCELLNEKKETLMMITRRFNWRLFRWEYTIVCSDLMPSEEVGSLITLTSLYYFRQIILFYW